MAPCRLLGTQLQLTSGHMESQQWRPPSLLKLLPIFDFFVGKILTEVQKKWSASLLTDFIIDKLLCLSVLWIFIVRLSHMSSEQDDNNNNNNNNYYYYY